MAFLTSEGTNHLVKKLSDSKNIKISGNQYGNRVSDVVNKLVEKADNITRAIEQQVTNTSWMFKVGTGDVDVSSDVEDSFGNVAIKGNTYQNLLAPCSSLSEVSVNMDGTLQTHNKGKVRVFYNKALVQPSKVYTLIFELLENTTDNETSTTVGKFNIVSYNNGCWSIPKGLEKGTYVIKLSQPAQTTHNAMPYFELYGKTTGDMKFKATLLEGDHTNNPNLPTYFKDIKGVGDKTVNLFNPNNVKFKISLNVNTGEEMNNELYVTSDFIQVDEDTKYTVKGLPVVHYYDENKEQIGIKNSDMEGIITTPVGCKWVRIRNYNKVLLNEQKLLVKQAMFALGENRRFEPYYDNYGVKVLSCGKNLIDPNIHIFNVSIGGDSGRQWKVGNGGNRRSIKIKCKPNTEYTISKTGGDRLGVWTHTADFDGNEQQLLNTMITNNNDTSGCITFTTPSNAKVLCIYVCLNELATNIQLEEVPTQTPYNYYTEDSTMILLDEPLMRLPNGVCDEITLDGKIIRRVGKVYLDGSESRYFKSSTNGTDNSRRYAARIPDVKLQHSVNLLCNTFIVRNESVDRGVKQIVIDDGTNVALYFCTASCETLDDFKQWLSQNPTTVYYELAEPIITDIDLESIRFFKDGHVQFNSIIVPESIHNVQLNKSAQIENCMKEVLSLDNRVEELECLYDHLLIQTSRDVDLLSFDYNLETGDE